MNSQEAEVVTVSKFAAEHGVSPTTVRRAIAAGHVQVDSKAKPMVVIGGELTWTIERWKSEMESAISGIKPHLRGWDAEGNLSVLKGTQIFTIERGYCAADLKSAAVTLKRLMK